MNLSPPAPRRTLPPLPQLSFVRGSVLLALAVVAASWVFVVLSDADSPGSFFRSDLFSRAWSFVRDLLGIDSTATPAFRQGGEWVRTGRLAVDTLAMSLLSIGIAAVAALLTFMFGASNVMMGELAPYHSRAWSAGFLVTRLVFILTRGVPELIWAMLILFVLSPGILPGAIAIGIHNGGILGKLSSEVVEGLDPSPMQALRAAGAGRFQVLAYGVLPQALPRLITYMLYRWEVIIRTTIIVGFVAAGGLGLEFRLAMSYFHYTSVLLVILWYLVLVLFVDLTAAALRKLANKQPA